MVSSCAFPRDGYMLRMRMWADSIATRAMAVVRECATMGPGCRRVIQLLILFLLLVTKGIHLQAIQLTFQGEDVVNHGFALRGPIGVADADTMMCLTNKTNCCSSAETGGATLGDWFFPNGSEVPTSSLGWYFYQTWGPQVVRLHRIGDGAAGIYRCRIPDINGTDQDLYVGLYSAASGMPNVTSIQFTLTSDLGAETPAFVLTCISESGPVEQVEWMRDGAALQENDTYEISEPTLVDTESATYHHNLTVTGRLPGNYICEVTSIRHTGTYSDSGSLTVVAASPPTNVSAEPINDTNAIQVSWTQPTGGATGYQIRYQTGSDQSSVDVEDSGATEHTLTNLQYDSTYNVTVIAHSQHLPSIESNSVTVTVAPPPLSAPNITETVATSPTSITISWSQEGDAQGFEIAFERVTGPMQQSPCPSMEDSGTVFVNDSITRNFTLTGLEEFSTYNISLTAIGDGVRSPASEDRVVTTYEAAPSGTPVSFSAVNVTSTSITMEWGPVNCTEQNSEITNFTLQYSITGSSVSVVVTLSGSSNAGGVHTISPLTPFTNYSIRVAAVNSGSQSGPFSTVVIETMEDVPSQVQNLTATANAVSIDVSWSEPETLNGIITAYEVHHQQQGGQENQTDSVTVTSTKLTGLRPETNYSVSVRAFTVAGPGEEENATTTTQNIPEVQNVVVESLNTTAVRVFWDPVEEVSFYTVYYSPVSDSSRLRQAQELTKTFPGGAAVGIIGDLVTGIWYQFQVVAVFEVSGETFAGERSQLNRKTKVIIGGNSENRPAVPSTPAADIAIATVGSVIVLCTAVLVVGIVTWNCRKQSSDKEQNN